MSIVQREDCCLLQVMVSVWAGRMSCRLRRPSQSQTICWTARRLRVKLPVCGIAAACTCVDCMALTGLIACWDMFQYKDSLSRYGIPIIEKRQPWDCFIFIMTIPILLRQHLYTFIETVPSPWSWTTWIALAAQDCSNSSALTVELSQSCIKPWTCCQH